MAPPKHALLFLIALLAVLSSAAAQEQPAPAPAAAGNCDPLRLSVCANLLGGLLNATLGLGGLIPGAGADGQCCPVIRGLVDLNVGACLCTAIRDNVLGLVRLDLAPLAARLLLIRCGQAAPASFTCPPA